MQFELKIRGRAIVLLVTVLSATTASTARAATIEHNLVVEPDFSTEQFLDSGGIVTRSSMNVPLPSMTLFPGDVLRVSLDFANGQYLRRIPTPPDAFQETSLGLRVANAETFPWSSFSGIDGLRTVQVFNGARQLVLEDVDISFHFVNVVTNVVWGTEVPIYDSLLTTDPPERRTIGKLFFELIMPTTLRGFSDTIPYPPTTYSMNEIALEFTIWEFRDEPTVTTAILVAPEPGGLMLAAIVCAGYSGRQVARRKTRRQIRAAINQRV